MAVRTRTSPDSEKVATVNVERKPIEQLLDHPRNEDIRKHPEPGSPKWEALKKSLSNDYFDPIVWNQRNGMLVSGHLRKKLLNSMGYTHVDVSVVDYDENTHIARLFAANRWMGDEDPGGQRELLRELGTDPDFDFGVAGFTEDELSLWGVFEDASGFDGLDGEEDDEDEPENVAESNVPTSDVKYLQLVFSAKDYAHVRSLLDDFKQRNAVALGERFAEHECFLLPNLLLFLLEQERAVAGLPVLKAPDQEAQQQEEEDVEENEDDEQDEQEVAETVQAPRKRSSAPAPAPTKTSSRRR
jgi:hypothetical protein